MWNRLINEDYFDVLLKELIDLFSEERLRFDQNVKKKQLDLEEASVVFKLAWADAVNKIGLV